MCPSKAGHRSESTDAKGEGSGGLDGDRQGAADALAQSTLPRHPPPQPEPPTPRAESPWLSTPPSRDLLVAVMRGVLQSSCPSPCCRAQPSPLGRPSGLSSAKNPLGPPVVCKMQSRGCGRAVSASGASTIPGLQGSATQHTLFPPCGHLHSLQGPASQERLPSEAHASSPFLPPPRKALSPPPRLALFPLLSPSQALGTSTGQAQVSANSRPFLMPAHSRSSGESAEGLI